MEELQAPPYLSHTIISPQEAKDRVVEELQARLDRVEMSAKEARSEAGRQDEATRRLRALLSQVGVDDDMWWWRDYHCGIISGRA